MTELSDLTCLVYDHGLFWPLAQKLAKTYKRVLYATPWEKGFPLLNDCVIGDGFENVERCNDIWKVKNECDLFVFPDIQHSGLQSELSSQGFPVWGSHDADSIEIMREKFLRILADVGLQVPSFEAVTGLTHLRQYLRDKEDKYIKISKYRGSLETRHWRNWSVDEGFLDVLSVRFGPAKEHVRFLVFDAIDTDLEIGGDTYCVNGQFPDRMVHGLEWKDKGYLGTVTRTEDMPSQIQDVLTAFAPVLAEHGMTNFWSMEIRVKDDESYFIDPCCRMPNPASGSQIELYDNLAEIIWHGAHGELVQPVCSKAFAAECVLTTKTEKNAWGVVEMPPELDEHAKFGVCAKIDGRICFPPIEPHGDEIGWLVSTGDSIKGTIETMKEYAAMLPIGVEANTASLFDLLKEVHSEEKEGIEFTHQEVPKPATALE